ncbi:MAG: hypothetical protein FJX77_02015 [Armatimonadetes bacterium]|nr:hypothetical protein [Armatimonadota bacterium]
MDELQQMLATARNNYARLKSDCESRVVRWVWSDGARFGIIPLLYEMDGIRPGRVVQRPLHNPDGMCHNGFDEEGRLGVVRVGSSFGLDDYAEEFYWHCGDRSYAAYYDRQPKGKPLSVSRVLRQDGHVVQAELLGRDYSRYDYTYEGNAISQVILHSETREGQECDQTFRFHYRNGKLWKIVDHDDPMRPYTVYRRR